MANIVNVTTSNTFEEWRVKTNEVGTAVGDLDNLTSLNIGAADIVAALTLSKSNVDTNTGSVGVMADLYGVHTNLVVASNDLDTRTSTNLTSIGTMGSLFGSHANLVVSSNDLNTRTITNLTSIGTMGSLYGSKTNLVTAINDAETRLGAAEVDIGTWSGYTGSSADITSAITAIELVQSNLSGNYVDVAGDTMTGALIAAGGVYAATGNYLNLGVNAINTIRINSNNRVGVGKAAHSSYKVDVSGTLNATDLKIGGESLDDRFLAASEAGGTSTISSVTEFSGAITMSKSLTLGSEKVFDSHASTGITFTEYTQDIVGAMFTGNTESGISAVYQDSDGTVDFDVDDFTITLTGDVGGVGTVTNLGNVSFVTTVADDSHNHVISNVDGLQSALNLKAALSDPDLTGTPTAPTAGAATNNTQLATTQYVTSAITALGGVAPNLLNTLNELAAAIGDDEDFAGTMTQNLAGKVGTSSIQALSTAANAMTITGHTITLARADGSTDSVTVPDNNDNTQRAIHDTPVNGATTTSISSNWAFDNVKTAVPAGAVFTDNNTTYSVGDNGLTQKNLTTALHTLLSGATDNNTNSTLVKRSSTGRVAVNTLEVGKNGGGDSEQFFYDDNSNDFRTLKWDDSSSEFQVEDNGGTMRTMYHSGNLPAATPHGINDVIVNGSTTTGKTIYINNNGPSGGSDGDVWFEY